MIKHGDFAVSVRNISFAYPAKPGQNVLENVSFFVRTGEIVCIAGPNGCGKTTLINIIAGFLRPTAGGIFFGGKNGFATVVFQQLGLLDWKTAKENIELALLSKKIPSSEKEKIVLGCLKLCQLETEKGKLPKELSGGMKQGVAIARALAAKPALLLLDEPFSSLDQQTRKELQKDIFWIARKTKTSIIIVTHHLDETIKHADRLLVLKTGKMEKKPGSWALSPDSPQAACPAIAQANPF